MTNEEIWKEYGGKEVEIVGYSRYNKDQVMTKGICIGSGYEDGHALIQSTDGWDEGHDGSYSIEFGDNGDSDLCWFIPYVDINIVNDNFIKF